jgi:protein transport protein SEC24
MATPQQPYTDGQPDPEGQDGEYGQQSQQAAPAAAAGGKKKRAYAGQAYEFGAGANAALGGQQPGGQQYPGSPPQMGGYGFPGQQPAAPQPSYGMPQQPAAPQPGYQDPTQAQGGQPQYGQPQYPAQQQGGYQPPQDSYQPPGQAPSMPAMAQQFQQMNVAGQQAAVSSQMRLNPLQPVDISMQGQPFHVADLDQPPPPIVLPPNVGSFAPQRTRQN